MRLNFDNKYSKPLILIGRGRVKAQARCVASGVLLEDSKVGVKVQERQVTYRKNSSFGWKSMVWLGLSLCNP